MRGRIARSPDASALAQPRFILGVESGTAAELRENALEGRIVIDKQSAGGGPDENLNPGRALEPLELRNVVDVFARCSHIESEIAEHAVTRTADLVGKGVRIGGWRV